MDKTHWVQATSTPKELGKHRADVLRERIEALQEDLRQRGLKAATNRAHFAQPQNASEPGVERRKSGRVVRHDIMTCECAACRGTRDSFTTSKR